MDREEVVRLINHPPSRLAAQVIRELFLHGFIQSHLLLQQYAERGERSPDLACSCITAPYNAGAYIMSDGKKSRGKSPQLFQ